MPSLSGISILPCISAILKQGTNLVVVDFEANFGTNGAQNG